MGDPFTTDPRAEELRKLILHIDSVLDKMFEILDSTPTVESPDLATKEM